MSRGPGYVQRYLTDLVLGSDKPMTFAEILAVAFPEGSYEADMTKALGGGYALVRSFPVPLRVLVDDGTVIAIGEGGRGDPKRYWLNPMLVNLSGQKERYDTVTTRLVAEPHDYLVGCHRRYGNEKDIYRSVSYSLFSLYGKCLNCVVQELSGRETKVIPQL